MQFSTATVTGNAHTKPGQPGKINNQDAIVVRRTVDTTVIVLADGCGSQPKSEVGADLGANITASLILKRLRYNRTINWNKLSKSLCRHIFQFTKYGSFEEFVLQRFMFTLTAVVIHRGVVTVAAFGDGMMVLDDKIHTFNIPIENTPPYLAYMLMKDSPYHNRKLRKYLQFRIMHHGPLSDIKKSLVVATDGLRDLPLHDIHHPALLAKPNTLQFWLASQAVEKIKDGRIIPGTCQDDIAMVLIRNDEAQDALLEERNNIVDQVNSRN